METIHTKFHEVPPDQVLTPLRVWEHANVPIKIVMAALVASCAVSLALWGWRLVRRSSAAPGQDAATRLMATIALAAPLLGLTAAAWNVYKACVGSVNDLPTPSVHDLMPAFAEAAMATFLGLAASSLAVLLLGSLRMRAGAAAAS